MTVVTHKVYDMLRASRITKSKKEKEQEQRPDNMRNKRHDLTATLAQGKGKTPTQKKKK